MLEVDLVDDADRYSTLAGYILWRLGHLPVSGEIVTAGELKFEVVTMSERNIGKVRVTRLQSE